MTTFGRSFLNNLSSQNFSTSPLLYKKSFVEFCFAFASPIDWSNFTPFMISLPGGTRLQMNSLKTRPNSPSHSALRTDPSVIVSGMVVTSMMMVNLIVMKMIM